MLTKLFLLPLILHVLLVIIIGLQTLRARIRAIRNGQAKIHEIAIDTGAWPRKVRQLGDNFSNQFESPMLWYGLAALVVSLQFVDLAFVVLSWMFLLTRLAHSYVHMGKNDVPSRMWIFLFGFFVLVAMWLWFAAKLFLTR